jgi:ABC-type transport system involved in multi-copper enzyme maturation permease subunit
VRTVARLLRSEFRRLFKDKGLIAIAIIIVVIGLFQILVASSSFYEDPYTGDIYWYMTLRDIIGTSFQISSTPYILIGIFTALFISKDISQGTIRNKLIAGYSKLEIYFSTIIIAAIVALAGMMLYHIVVMSFIWRVPFPIDDTVPHDLQNFIIYWALGYLLILVATSFITFFSLMVKNTAGAMVLSIAFLVFLLFFAILTEALFSYWFVYSKFDLYTQAQEAEDALRRMYLILDYFYPYQLLKYSTSLFNPTDFTNFYSTEGTNYLFKVLGTNVGLLALLNVGGAFWFRKTDLK